MKDPDKYYVTLGQVLVEDTLAAHPEKKMVLGMIMKNDYALEQMARKHEENVKASGNIILEEQLQMYDMRARGRMERDK